MTESIKFMVERMETSNENMVTYQDQKYISKPIVYETNNKIKGRYETGSDDEVENLKNSRYSREKNGGVNKRDREEHADDITNPRLQKKYDQFPNMPFEMMPLPMQMSFMELMQNSKNQMINQASRNVNNSMNQSSLPHGKHRCHSYDRNFKTSSF